MELSDMLVVGNDMYMFEKRFRDLGVELCLFIKFYFQNADKDRSARSATPSYSWRAVADQVHWGELSRDFLRWKLDSIKKSSPAY